MGRISVVLLGRLIGATTIVVGISLSIWSSADYNYGGAEQYIRTFLSQVLGWLASGSLIYLAAEIFDEVVLQRTVQPEGEQSDWAVQSGSLGGKGD